MPGLKRVLILHDYGGSRGGAELLALDFRRLLKSRGIDARLFVCDADTWSAEEAPDYTATGSVGRFRAYREAWNPSALRRLGQVIDDFQPDIAQIVMFLSQLSPAILGQLEAIPTVYSINTYRAVCPTGMRWGPNIGICERKAGLGCTTVGCISLLGLPLRLTQLRVLRGVQSVIDRTVVPSTAMAGIIARHGWPATNMIPHAVPTHDRERPMGDIPVIAFSGRLVPEKGVEVLLQAFARAIETQPQIRLRIIGNGPDRPRLERIARHLHLSEVVTFKGHLTRADSQAELETAWVQAVPSLWAEPFGLVAAEALARGTPIIASDAGGPAEIVTHNVTGWVVPTGDVAALASAISEALADRALLQRMGDVGRAHAAERYGEDAWIEKYLSVYAAMLADAPPSPP